MKVARERLVGVAALLEARAVRAVLGARVVAMAVAVGMELARAAADLAVGSQAARQEEVP